MVEEIRAFCLHQTFVPTGFSALALGLNTYMIMCIKSDFEETILKLAVYGQREKAFLLSSKFCPQWIGAPARGYIHMVKHEKKNSYIKSDFKAIFLNLGKVIRAFC